MKLYRTVKRKQHLYVYFFYQKNTFTTTYCQEFVTFQANSTTCDAFCVISITAFEKTFLRVTLIQWTVLHGLKIVPVLEYLCLISCIDNTLFVGVPLRKLLLGERILKVLNCFKLC